MSEETIKERLEKAADLEQERLEFAKAITGLKNAGISNQEIARLLDLKESSVRNFLTLESAEMDQEQFNFSIIMPEGHESTYFDGFAYELSNSFRQIHKAMTDHAVDMRKEANKKVAKFEVRITLFYEETDKPYLEPPKNAGWLNILK